MTDTSDQTRSRKIYLHGMSFQTANVGVMAASSHPKCNLIATLSGEHWLHDLSYQTWASCWKALMTHSDIGQVSPSNFRMIGHEDVPSAQPALVHLGLSSNRILHTSQVNRNLTESTGPHNWSSCDSHWAHWRPKHHPGRKWHKKSPGAP